VTGPASQGIGARLETRIYLIRGLRVMLDSDLAEMYAVATKVLNQAVRGMLLVSRLILPFGLPPRIWEV